jgi:hypothetical protein
MKKETTHMKERRMVRRKKIKKRKGVAKSEQGRRWGRVRNDG